MHQEAEKCNFSLIKDRIIKTSRIIEMYQEKEAVLSKATKAFKNLKQLYEKSLSNCKRLEHENSLVSYRNKVLTAKIDEFYSNYNKILTELEAVKPEQEKLLKKYNEKLIENQQLEIQYKKILMKCTCHQEFNENEFKYKGMKMYRELKQKYDQLRLKFQKTESDSEEKLPQILKEATFIQEIDLVTRFTDSPTIIENFNKIESLKRQQIERRRKFWIPNNYYNLPKRKTTKKSLSKFSNLLNRLVKAKINKIMRKKRLRKEFTSETESELERLFYKKKRGILGRNRRLIALAKIQNAISSDSDLPDSGLVTASPKNSTEDNWSPENHRKFEILEDSWVGEAPLEVLEEFQRETRNFEEKSRIFEDLNVVATLESSNLDSGTCEAPLEVLEDLQRDATLDLRNFEEKSRIFEDKNLAATLESSNLDLGFCEAQDDLEREKSLDLRNFEDNSRISEDPEVEATLETLNLDLETCEASLEILEDSEKEKSLDLGNFEDNSRISEDLNAQATLEISNLDLETCEVVVEVLEEPQIGKSLNSRNFEEKSRIIENLINEATLESSDPNLEISKAQEDSEREKSLNSRNFEDKLETFEALTNEATLETSDLNLETCEASLEVLEDSEREKSLDLRNFEEKSRISEGTNVEATLEASYLDSETSEAHKNNLGDSEGEKSLDLRNFEEKLETFEEIIDEATLETPDLDLETSEAPLAILEDLQREKSLDLRKFEEKLETLEEITDQATLEASYLDLETSEAQGNNLEDSKREKSLDLGNFEDKLNTFEEIIDEATLETSEALLAIPEESDHSEAKFTLNSSNSDSESSTSDSESSSSDSESLMSIIKSLETLRPAPMLSPLPQSPQKSDFIAKKRQKIDFEAEIRAPKRKIPLIMPTDAAKIQKLDVLTSILEEMGPLKPLEAPKFNEIEGPLSPDVVEELFEPPKLIPLEKFQKLTAEEVRNLFDELLMFSSNEFALNDIVMRFRGQNTDFLAWIVLEKLKTDSGKIEKRGNNPNRPPLTQLQQILLGFLLKLEKSLNPGILDKFLDLADRVGQRRHNNNISRLFAAICKMRNDLLRARKFVFNSFRCNKNLAPLSVFFAVLKIFPQILPISAANGDPLAKALVHICFHKLRNGGLTCSKFLYLGDLLKSYYNYNEEPIEAIFDEFFEIFIKKPANKQIQWALLLLLIHQKEDWSFNKIETNFWPLFSKIPHKNSNLRATMILFVAKICKNFENEEILGKVRQWFGNLLKIGEEEGDILVKRSLIYVCKNYPQIGFT